MQPFSFVLVLAAAIAIFFTTATGRRIADDIGFRPGMKDPAPKQDRAYLLRICNGDVSAVDAMLEAARSKRPELTEREAYRAAIRAHLHDKI